MTQRAGVRRRRLRVFARHADVVEVTVARPPPIMDRTRPVGSTVEQPGRQPRGRTAEPFEHRTSRRRQRGQPTARHATPKRGAADREPAVAGRDELMAHPRPGKAVRRG
jgi:hypothetical protein